MLTLESTTGTGTLFLVNRGSLTLSVALHRHLEHYDYAVANKPLVMNADNDSNGSGTLTVASNKLIDSNDSDVTITAWDLDLAGSLTSGNRPVSIHGAQATQSVGVGTITTAALKNQYIEDAELGKVTTTAGLFIGNEPIGNMVVKDTTEANTDSVATLNLMPRSTTSMCCLKPHNQTFNKGIIVKGMGGVILSGSLTTSAGHTAISTGTGTNNGGRKSLKSTNQLLTITADDSASPTLL